MKDALGKEVNVDDVIVYADQCLLYLELSFGRVEEMLEKSVIVSWLAGSTPRPVNRLATVSVFTPFVVINGVDVSKLIAGQLRKENV